MGMRRAEKHPQTVMPQLMPMPESMSANILCYVQEKGYVARTLKHLGCEL